MTMRSFGRTAGQVNCGRPVVPNLGGSMKTATVSLGISAIPLLVLAVFATTGVPAQEGGSLKDFTNIKLEEFGIKPVEPKKDATTGFIAGGKNATELIKGLSEINGKPIADLEKVMRPGAASVAGFLGKNEKLLEVMAADNEYVVDKLGSTHQELAHHLHAMGAVWLWQLKNKQLETEFLYHGRKFKVEGTATFGFQDSPFDDGTKSGSDIIVHNLSNSKKVGYGLLVPYMVERYGFYEGKGTSYRLDPRKVVDVFDFIKGKKKADRRSQQFDWANKDNARHSWIEVTKDKEKDVGVSVQFSAVDKVALAVTMKIPPGQAKLKNLAVALALLSQDDKPSHVRPIFSAPIELRFTEDGTLVGHLSIKKDLLPNLTVELRCGEVDGPQQIYQFNVNSYLAR